MTRPAAPRRRRWAGRRSPPSRRSGRAPGSSPLRSPRRGCRHPGAACRTPFVRLATRWHSRPRRASPPIGSGGAAVLAASERGYRAPARPRRRRRRRREIHGATAARTRNDSCEMRVRRLRRRVGPVNLLPVDVTDPPSGRAVVRGILGAAIVLAGLALVVVSIGAGHIEWRLVALVLALWGAWGFFDSLFGWVLEPLGRFVGDALTGGSMPGDSTITIHDETAMLEHLGGGGGSAST